MNGSCKPLNGKQTPTNAKYINRWRLYPKVFKYLKTIGIQNYVKKINSNDCRL